MSIQPNENSQTTTWNPSSPFKYFHFVKVTNVCLLNLSSKFKNHFHFLWCLSPRPKLILLLTNNPKPHVSRSNQIPMDNISPALHYFLLNIFSFILKCHFHKLSVRWVQFHVVLKLIGSVQNLVSCLAVYSCLLSHQRLSLILRWA